MRIGFDGRFIRRYQTGNGQTSQQMIKGMADIDDNNEYIIYLVEDIEFIKKRNFHLKLMPLLHSNAQLRFLFTFPIELLRNPVDVFHALYTVPFLPFRTSTRIVLSLVEFSWFINPDDFPASRLFMAQVRMTTRYSIHRADRIITPTNYMKNQMLNHFHMPPEKIEVIPWGVNEDFFVRCNVNEIMNVKQKFGIDGEYIFYVGDIHPRKNLHRLIDAFSWLKETKGVPHRLVLAGKSLYRASDIYQRASSSKAAESIIFTGYLSFDELRALYQGASVFAFPSLDEGFGLPVHEAMASCVPVVTSTRGTLPEVAGNAALFVDPLDIEDIGTALFKLLDSPELSAEMIRRGNAQVRMYSWRESCRKILRIYKELASEGELRRN
jgi:glycosyltransferase involved in cell wall biosynthesis